MNRETDYIYYQASRSICDICLRQVEAKIIIRDNSVFVKKYCPIHGNQEHMLEYNAGYHQKKVLYDKPATLHNTETTVKKGCPYDCGLCANHEQHTCIGLIEVTNRCNMDCPMCYSGHDNKQTDLDIQTITKMVDFYIESEGGKAEILQISGGEPTVHKDIIEILKICKSKNIGHLMLNTNGIKIAEDIEFVKELAKLIDGFEVYLQFDSLNDDVYQKLRGKKLFEIKKKAINNLNYYNIPATLVCTVSRGINDCEMADIINLGLETPCIRGVNFQPVARFGGYEEHTEDSFTVSELLHKIESSSGSILKESDFVPLPCNVERVAVTYLYRTKKGFVPITRNRNIEKYVPYISNTFMFSIEESLANGESPVFGFCKCLDFLGDFNKLIPKNFFNKTKEERVKYLNENTFRISVSSFVDKYNFDIKSMQKECVHIVTPELKRIPFSAYNIIYRNKIKQGELFAEQLV